MEEKYIKMLCLTENLSIYSIDCIKNNGEASLEKYT